MEIVASLPTNTRGATGGTKKHIEEWSRLDNFSGVLEHARVEADHWTSNTSNSRHRFGKVVDSRARNLADGSVQQQQQTKQLEVFQAHIPGGSVQVIRSHTSTSSSWHNSKILHSKSHVDRSSGINSNFFNRSSKIMESPIADLKFQHNLVNLEPEKTKVNVARYLPARRPPTRTKKASPSEEEFFNNLPKMCSEAENETEKRLNAIAIELKSSLSESPNAGDNVLISNGVVNDEATEHAKLEKKKSVSDENLNIVDEKENSDPWKRDSKARWSFQYPRSKFKRGKFDANTSKNELESVLEKVLKRKGDSKEGNVKFEMQVTNASPKLYAATMRKRNSFVTAQALKETKQRLRKLSERERKMEISRNENEETETDDGICTEIKELNSDIEYDNEILLVKGKQDSSGTGSLECRGKNKSENWYDRRKSYGFEPVYNHKNISTNIKSNIKNNLSTDSGICHSSELELASTPIVKKLTEVNDERMRVASKLEMNRIQSENYERSGVSQVSELLNKFEKQSLLCANASSVFSVRQKSPCFSDSFSNTTRTGNVAALIKTLGEKKPHLESKTRHTSVVHSSPDLQQQQIPFKRHSIACDDATYNTKLSQEKTVDRASVSGTAALSSSTSSCLVPENTNFSPVVNVNEYDCGDLSLSSPAFYLSDSTDVKRPKKVEFSKTEVHFAAAEPGKVKIVETNEKPPPANLHRRKKRSLNVSPKRYSPLHSKFEYEKTPDMNINDSLLQPHQLNNVDPTDNCCNFGGTQFTSTTCDNGLAVRISSSAESNNEFKQDSWSLIDTNDDNKLGYSTKVNFGGEGIIVIADTKSHQLKNLETSQRYSTTKSLDLINGHHCNGKAIAPQKLIVKIDGSTTGVANARIMRNSLTNNFCKSLYDVHSGVIGENKLKSTSLIIDTLKHSMNQNDQITTYTNRAPGKHCSEAEMVKKKNCELKMKNNKCFVEQPSTYITEMNKLQQKYRIKQNLTIDKFAQGKNDDKLKSTIYNTVPLQRAKNGFTRPKMLANDFSSLLNAFDDLYQSINDAIEEDRNNASVKRVNYNSVKQDIHNKRTNFQTTSSSQSCFSNKIISRDDGEDGGDLSDDSLKADEEVRSYMSTAIMEEYENELTGSWSRKRYHKYIKSSSATKGDEISEKSHFKPLRSEEEVLKTVTGATNVDIKRPQITAVAVNLTPQSCGSSSLSWTGDIKQKRCTTSVLLNNSVPIFEKPPKMLSESSSESSKRAMIAAGSSVDSKNEQSNTSLRITTSVQAVAKVENKYEPVKIVRHDDKIKVSVKQVTSEQCANTTKKETTSSSSRSRKPPQKTCASLHDGSFRRRIGYDRDKLFSSGRDSWLNLPKEYKYSDKKLYGNCTKIRPTQMPPEEFRRSSSERHSCKSSLDNLPSVGLTNNSSEEELLRRSFRKPFTKPMTTISEKSRLQVDGKTDTRGFKLPSKAPVTQTTSNSSLESHSNSFEFRTPVLKTEERSRRRAARMMQIASSREALMNLKSSSEDITSENEVNRIRSHKVKNSMSQRKMKSSNISKAEQKLLARPDCNRLIQQKTAKMEINIFKIKEMPKDRNVANESCSRTSLYAVNTITKPNQRGNRERGPKISQTTSITQRSVVNQNKAIHEISDSRKVAK